MSNLYESAFDEPSEWTEVPIDDEDIILEKNRKRGERRKREFLERKRTETLISNVDYPRVCWVKSNNHIKFRPPAEVRRYYKKRANRAVRRYEGELSNGNNYRRIYGYWNKVS